MFESSFLTKPLVFHKTNPFLMPSYFSQKFSFFVRNGGYASAMTRALFAFTRRYLGVELNPLLRKRIAVSSKISRHFHGVIQKGVFHGVKLPSSFFRRSWTNGTIVLGQYERPVAAVLHLLSSEGFTGLIDIGAANGYYVVASLQVGLFKNAIAFESSASYRKSMVDWLRACSLDSQVCIRGSATKDELVNLSQQDLSLYVLLIDIDGGEFSLLDENVFASYSDNAFIVELHDWLFADSDEKRANLVNSSSNTHVPFILRGDSMDLGGVKLPPLSDIELFMASADGRPFIGEWLILLPIGPRFSGLRDSLSRIACDMPPF